MRPTAPVLSTGPSSIVTPHAWNNKMTFVHYIWWIVNVVGFSICCACVMYTSTEITWRWAATVFSGVVVIRHKSTDPGVGFLALGSNSFPTWCRFSFCSPKLNALRSPWNTRHTHVESVLNAFKCDYLLPWKWWPPFPKLWCRNEWFCSGLGLWEPGGPDDWCEPDRNFWSGLTAL